MKKEITQKYGKALELHNKILVSAQLAQSNLWEMCSGLKEMRDDKLYRELGYQSFEDYCGAEFNINRNQAYKYISIIENTKEENVSSRIHFGVTKLYLLSTLSESEQEKITAENDVESMTVKELEKEIKQLKSDNDRLKNINADIAEQLNIAREDYRSVHQEKLELRKQVAHLQDDIDVLEARPVEVAVAEPSEDVRQLKLTIKNLEKSTERQLEQLQDEHLRDVQKLHRQHAEEQREALEAQKRSYEERIADLEIKLEDSGDTHDDELSKLCIYISAAHDALFKLAGFASSCSDKSACFVEIKELLAEFEAVNDDLIYGRQ